VLITHFTQDYIGRSYTHLFRYSSYVGKTFTEDYIHPLSSTPESWSGAVKCRVTSSQHYHLAASKVW